MSLHDLSDVRPCGCSAGTRRYSTGPARQHGASTSGRRDRPPDTPYGGDQRPSVLASHALPGRRARRGFAALLLAMATLPAFGVVAASAHGDEEPVPARQSVLQAIAYLVNTPQDTEMIADKVTDAVDSSNKAGVDVAALTRAQQAVEAGDLLQARVALEQAVGAKVDLTGLQVRHVLQVPPGLPDVSLATGAGTGTVVVTDEMPGRGPLTGADAAGLALAAVGGGAGLVLAVRTRPTHSLRTLRAATPARTTPEGGVS